MTSTVGGELDVAAHMIAVRVRVDDRGHGFIGQRLDLVEDRLPPAWVLRVDDHDALRRDEDCGISATVPVLQDVKVIFDFVDLESLFGRMRGLLKRRQRHRQRARDQQSSKQNTSLHRFLAS